MAYIIKKTDGTVLLTLQDGRVNQLTTSLSLLGKNVDSYGEFYNNNLVGLLENFSSVAPPRAPLVGQLWHNRADDTVYVYSKTNKFQTVTGNSSAIVSSSNPIENGTLISPGDLWVDTTNNQLNFTTDGTSFITAGPKFENKSFAISIDISQMLTPNTDIIAYLDKLLPVTNLLISDSSYNLPNGIRARVLCSFTPKAISLNLSIANVDQNSVPLLQSVVTGVTGSTANTTYIVKEFKVLSGHWNYIQDVL